jgi:hypothetical protein
MLERQSLKFLLLDISMDELTELKNTFTNIDMNIDFYIYGSYSKDIKWLSKVVEQADHIVINNTQLTEHIDLKKEIASSTKSNVITDEKSVIDLILERCQ